MSTVAATRSHFLSELTKCFKSRELEEGACLQTGSLSVLRAAVRSDERFLLRSLCVHRAEILGRLSSSLLPPSFARGRFATLFFAAAPAGPALTGGARPARA